MTIKERVDAIEKLYDTVRQLGKKSIQLRNKDISTNIISGLVKDFADDGFKSLIPVYGQWKVIRNVIGTAASWLGIESILPSWLQSTAYKMKKQAEANRQTLLDVLEQQINDLNSEREALIQNLTNDITEENFDLKQQVNNSNINILEHADSDNVVEQLKKKNKKRLDRISQMKQVQQDVITPTLNRMKRGEDELSKTVKAINNMTDLDYDGLKFSNFNKINESNKEVQELVNK